MIINFFTFPLRLIRHAMIPKKHSHFFPPKNLKFASVRQHIAYNIQHTPYTIQQTTFTNDLKV